MIKTRLTLNAFGAIPLFDCIWPSLRPDHLPTSANANLWSRMATCHRQSRRAASLRTVSIALDSLALGATPSRTERALTRLAQTCTAHPGEVELYGDGGTVVTM